MIDVREHYKTLKCATCMISCGCSHQCIRGDDLCEIYELRAALKEIIRIKDDTLGPRGGGITPLKGQEHFDRGCRMAFYRCAKIAADALGQSEPTASAAESS